MLREARGNPNRLTVWSIGEGEEAHPYKEQAMVLVTDILTEDRLAILDS